MSFPQKTSCPFQPISPSVSAHFSPILSAADFFLVTKTRHVTENAYLCAMMTTKEQIAALRQAIEESTGQRPQTPKDFDLLSNSIYNRVGELVSRNTLRRIWGRMADEREPRHSTLSILARFIGYADIEAFVTNSTATDDEQPSSLSLSRQLSVIDGLTHGDCLRLMWHPGRVCDVEYSGDLHFRVIASKNTKLSPGDTFLCSLIIEGQPLYLDQLKQGTNPPTAYICGKQGGVRFELLQQ